MQGRGIDAVFDEVIFPTKEVMTQDMETWGDCSALLPWLSVKGLDTRRNNKRLPALQSIETEWRASVIARLSHPVCGLDCNQVNVVCNYKTCCGSNKQTKNLKAK